MTSPWRIPLLRWCALLRGGCARLEISIAYLWLGNVLGMNLRPVLLMLGKLKEWGDAGHYLRRRRLIKVQTILRPASA